MSSDQRVMWLPAAAIIAMIIIMTMAAEA